MRRVKLYTKARQYVVTVLVPDFRGEQPEVVRWGDRVFVRVQPDVYVEGMMFHVTYVEPDEDMKEGGEGYAA